MRYKVLPPKPIQGHEEQASTHHAESHDRPVKKDMKLPWAPASGADQDADVRDQLAEARKAWAKQE